MKQNLITFISVVIVLILALSILLQQAQCYHRIIREAKKFADHQYFPKNYGKRTVNFVKRFIEVFK
jgi:hypothetical protein